MGAANESLFEQAVRGESAALRSLLQEYAPAVRDAVAPKIGRQWRSVLDADDIMQVTYLEAFLRIDQLTAPDPASFTAWLMRIAENNLRDAVRILECAKRPPPRRQIQAPASAGSSHVALLELLAADTATPSRRAAAREAIAIIDSALSRLPRDYEQAVRLYDLEGRPVEEIAAAMGRSVGAVHMLRYRGHARLREELGSASRFFSDTP